MSDSQLNQEPRREIKIVVEGMHVQKVRYLVRMHPAAFYPVFQPRRINNLYLDTNDFSHYHQNVNGLARRVKPRIRWYGAGSLPTKNPVLEIKIKNNLWGTKKRYPLDPGELGQCLDRSPFTPLALGFPAGLQTYRPTVGNSYTREYFLSFDGLYRLTLDTEVTYFKIDQDGQPETSFGWRDPDSRIVLEIKCDRAHEPGLPGVVQAFPFRASRNSKYVNGVRKVFGAP